MNKIEISGCKLPKILATGHSIVLPSFIVHPCQFVKQNKCQPARSIVLWKQFCRKNRLWESLEVFNSLATR